MKKKTFFTLLLIVIASGILAFTINESLKRIEKNAIEVYLDSIKSEFAEHLIKVSIDEVVCNGFIKHTCKIPTIKIINQKQAQNLEITLQDIDISITHISHKDIGVIFKINKIQHNSAHNPYLVLLPQAFTYTLSLQKQDSALGYVAINRSIYLAFNHFTLDINLNVLLRGQLFRDKSIFFLLKEWFDSTTPSFYEYSLNSLTFHIASTQKNIDPKYIQTMKNTLDLVLHHTQKEYKRHNTRAKNTLLTHYFDKLIDNYYDLLRGKIATINLNVERSNKYLEFFNLISNEASLKKSLEILETLESINETYRIDFEAK